MRQKVASSLLLSREYYHKSEENHCEAIFYILHGKSGTVE